MNKKDNKSKQNSKSKIANAFMELVDSKAIKDITVTDLCIKANVNRSTFYACYIDIYDLIEKIGEKAFRDFQELHKDDSDFEYLIKLLRYIKENQLFYKTYAKLRTDNYFDNVGFGRLNKHIEPDDAYTEYNRAFVRAGASKVINLWLERDCDITPEELYEIIKKFN